MKLQTYQDVLSLPTNEFIAHLSKFYVDLSFDPENPEEASKAGKDLEKIANSYAYLTALHSFASMEKRRLSRKDSRAEYQDLIDKETAIKDARDAVSMQQKTLSKLLSLHMDLRKELYMGDSVRKPNG